MNNKNSVTIDFKNVLVCVGEASNTNAIILFANSLQTTSMDAVRISFAYESNYINADASSGAEKKVKEN